MNNCPLCNSTANTFFKEEFFECTVCLGVFRASKYLPSKDKEEERYLQHNNNVNDQGYRNFVKPLVDKIIQDNAKTNKGLDFGAGPGPVGALMLEENGYDISLYDPLFYNSKELLKEQYDYILCCEVVEHFHNPALDFQLLKSLLKTKGKLYIMTHILEDGIPFANWYYKNDFTHVFFYRKQTFEWIKEHFSFSFISIEGRVIVLAN